LRCKQSRSPNNNDYQKNEPYGLFDPIFNHMIFPYSVPNAIDSLCLCRAASRQDPQYINPKTGRQSEIDRKN
jgi:hypothetical protein